MGRIYNNNLSDDYALTNKKETFFFLFVFFYVMNKFSLDFQDY